MKAKALLIIGGVILILEGGLLISTWFDYQYMSYVCYGSILAFVGIIGIIGALLAKQKKAGYFFAIMGVAIWLPVILTLMDANANNANIGSVALVLGLPALIVTVLWCAGGVKNINR